MNSMSIAANSQTLLGVTENVMSVSAGKPANNGSNVSATGQSGVETASLSAAAGVLATMLPSSDVRMDRVTSLQQAIAAGTYSVSAADVADKMLRALMN